MRAAPAAAPPPREPPRGAHFLARQRHAQERPGSRALAAGCCQATIGMARLIQRSLRPQCKEGMLLLVELMDALQASAGEFQPADLAVEQRAGSLGQRKLSEVHGPGRLNRRPAARGTCLARGPGPGARPPQARARHAARRRESPRVAQAPRWSDESRRYRQLAGEPHTRERLPIALDTARPRRLAGVEVPAG